MSRGYTLIETVVALAVFMLISMSAVQMLGYASAAGDRIWTRSELLENARIAADVLSVYIRSADGVEIVTRDGVMSQLTVKYKQGLITDSHVFFHNSDSESGGYQRLTFGGNELASHIAGIKCKLDGDLLTLTITTAGRAGVKSKRDANPVSLTAKIKIYDEISITGG